MNGYCCCEPLTPSKPPQGMKPECGRETVSNAFCATPVASNVFLAFLSIQERPTWQTDVPTDLLYPIRRYNWRDTDGHRDHPQKWA